MIASNRNLRRGRWRAIIVALLVLLFLIGLLPTMMGTRWVYQPLVDQLAIDNFRLEVGVVRMRWLSPLRLERIQLRETNGQTLFTIAAIETDRGLLSYLTGGRRLGKIEIVEPTLNIKLLREGNNLEKILESFDQATQTSGSRSKQRPAIDIEVVIRQLSATVEREDTAGPLIVIPSFDMEFSYRAAEGNSRVVVSPTKVLDQVELTQELVDLGLGHAVPLLAKSLWFDGRVSLSLSRLDIPLDQPLRSVGQAEVTLHQVRSGPSDPAIQGLLDFVSRLRGHEPQHELVFVDGSNVSIAVADSRIHHSGLRFGLPRVDQRLQMATSGSVGMEDRSLDMQLQLPVPLEQLALRESVQRLGVPALQLPIGGTLDDPRVRWDVLRGETGLLLGQMRASVAGDSAATASVLGALEGLAEGKADQAISSTIDLLQQWRGRRNASGPGTNEPLDPDQSAASDQEPEKKRPLLDALRKALQRQDN